MKILPAFNVKELVRVRVHAGAPEKVSARVMAIHIKQDSNNIKHRFYTLRTITNGDIMYDVNEDLVSQPISTTGFSYRTDGNIL